MPNPAAAGSELEVFEKAVHWKRYFASHMRRYIRGKVLEAGAGIGANLKIFEDRDFERWTCLEPDPEHARRLANGSRYEVVVATLGELRSAFAGRRFDVILYIDVLEHIEDDRAELQRASAYLSRGGALIVLAPAHPWLFTPFDAAIGHFRRYTKRTLAAAAPLELSLEKLIYLDAAGLAASAANRLLLKSAMPTGTQVQIWDRLLVPLSHILDPLLGYRCGKSVLGIWVSR